ncbi:MAG: leucine-rich repeat protein [Clostridia bacterium]|nr:leucine-rich repeat protein [Clostridia bacterium]
MKKTKNFIKTAIFALTIILTVAIAFGISGAWYSAQRKATSTVRLDNGIIIDYSGFNEGSGTWTDNSVVFELFNTNGGSLPGTTINLNEASIIANASSVDFFARVKLTYKFFTDVEGIVDVTNQIADYSSFISTPNFAADWVYSADGWNYYSTNGDLTVVINDAYVNIFENDATIELNGYAEGFFHEGGGYKYSEEILIKRIEVELTLQAYQANAQGAANVGWGIYVPGEPEQYLDTAANVYYTQNFDGTWTLTNGQSINSSSSNTTATYAAKVYDSSYSYTILSSINGQDVVAIGDEAFLNASQLTAVEIPTTVTTIGNRAFEGTGLTAVTLPQSVAEVGADALAANSITEVTIEKSDAIVSGIATAGIPAATVVNVPSAVLNDYETTLGTENYSIQAASSPAQQTASEGLEYEFDSSTQSYTVTGIGTFEGTELVIPETYNGYSVTKIGYSAFYSVTFLSTVTIPNSVQEVDDWAFASCSGLTSINLSNSIIDLGQGVFYYSGLESINIPGSVVNIGESCFANCTKLSSVIIGLGVETIGSRAFSWCTKLERFVSSGCYITSADQRCLISPSNELVGFARYGLSAYSIPNNIERIGEDAFYCWTSLSSIEIPDSVTSIGANAFNGCPNLSSVILPSTLISIDEAAFRDSGLVSIVIPASVTSIDNCAFSVCYNLNSVIIEGNGRTSDLSIYNEVFAYNNNLHVVTFDGDWTGINLTVFDNAFSGSPIESTVQIPNQS